MSVHNFIIIISMCAIINARSISQETSDKSVINSSLTTTNEYKDFVQRSLNPMDMINRNGFVHQKFELKRRLEMRKPTKIPPTQNTSSKKPSIPDSHFTSFQSWGPVGK